MIRTITIGIEVTTDELDETLLDPKLWAKAVGVFKSRFIVNSVVIGGTDKGAMKKPLKKKAGTKKRATKKKKKTSTKKKKPAED